MFFVVVLLCLVVRGVGAEPAITITEPGDGDWFVKPRIDVIGSSDTDTRFLNLTSDEFGMGTFESVTMKDGRLVLNPIRQFDDGFSGPDLDTEVWEWVSLGDYGFDDGQLRLGSLNLTTHPFIVSRGEVFPDGSDWSCRVKMRFTDWSDYLRGFGVGMTANETDALSSVVATYSDHYINPNYFSILANGRFVADWVDIHYIGTLQVDYHLENDTYMVYYHGKRVTEFTGVEGPVRFWLGCDVYDELDDWSIMQIYVDQIDIWTHSGSWTSRVYDLGGSIEVERVSRHWTTSHDLDDRVRVEYRASEDNVSWSNWSRLGSNDGVYEGRYFQFRVLMSLDAVRDHDAYIRMGSIQIEYHHPLKDLQVRLNGGEWKSVTFSTSGSWEHRLDLAEDENLVEARIYDSAGYENSTAVTVVLDTTAPTGTAMMDVENIYTNDTNVTFWFNATDRYGLKAVRIALDTLYMNEQVFEPYVDTMVWVLPGGFVETDVYIRFEDNHGLLSEPIHFVFYHDPLPPTGVLHIMGGADYTDQTVVHIDLDYQDNAGIASVELGRDGSFIDTVTIEPGVHRYEGWELGPGGSGERRVYMRVIDLAGNQVVVFDDIELYVAEALGGIEVEDPTVTATRLVQVTVFPPTGFDAYWMQISEDMDFTNDGWMDLNNYTTLQLSEGDGVKMVHARFKDSRGYTTLPVSTSVTLDTTPPVLSLTLNGGTYFTSGTNVYVLLEYEDQMDPDEMWYHENDDLSKATSIGFTTSFEWSIEAKEGVHTLNVWVSDIAGNVGRTVASVYYATRAPVCVLSVVGGQYSNALEEVEVDLQVIDEYNLPTQVQLGFDADPQIDIPWETSASTMSVRIPAGTTEGTHRVTVRARSSIGLISQVASTSLVLDWTPPTCTILEPEDGSHHTLKDTVLVLRLDYDDDVGISTVMYSVDGGEWTGMGSVAKAEAIDLVEFGDHTVIVRVLDLAGNEVEVGTEFYVEEETFSLGTVAVLVVVAAAVAVLGILLWRRAGART